MKGFRKITAVVAGLCALLSVCSLPLCVSADDGSDSIPQVWKGEKAAGIAVSEEVPRESSLQAGTDTQRRRVTNRRSPPTSLSTRPSGLGTRLFLTASFIAAAIFMFWRAGNVFWRCLTDVGAAEKSGAGSTPRSLSSSNKLEECAQELLKSEETKKLQQSPLFKLSQGPLGVGPTAMLVIAIMAVGLVATTQGMPRLPDAEGPAPYKASEWENTVFALFNLPKIEEPESDKQARPTRDTFTAASTSGGKWAEWFGELPVPDQGYPGVTPVKVEDGVVTYEVGRHWTGRGNKMAKYDEPIVVTFFDQMKFLIYLPETVDTALRDEGVLSNFQSSIKSVRFRRKGEKPRMIWGKFDGPAFALYKTFETPTVKYEVFLPEGAVSVLKDRARVGQYADSDLQLLLGAVLQRVHESLRVPTSAPGISTPAPEASV